MEQDKTEPRRFSKLYRALANIAYFCLLALFTAMLITTLLALDFLDIVQWRYKIPENMRGKWPISLYFDLVKLHQLPDEERYQELLLQEKRRYEETIGSESANLKKRAQELENAYRELTRAQEENYRKSREELRIKEEELLKERKKLEALEADLNVRKESIDTVSRQLASQAAAIEAGILKFFENENQLKPIQEIASSMDSHAMAMIFNEVSDDSLIYRILKGIPAERAAAVLAAMDPDKAGKIIKISQNPPALPSPTAPADAYIPQSLKNLVATAQANLR